MKKGFTLIELLGVIVILSVIASIIYPSVLKIINNQRIKLKNDNIATIEASAYQYTILNNEEMAGVTSMQLSVEQLQNAGVLTKTTFTDPTTNQQMNGCVKVTYNNLKQKYDFKYQSTCE